MGHALQACGESEQECAATLPASSGAQIPAAEGLSAITWNDAKSISSVQYVRSISGLVAEYIVAIDVTRVQFPG